MSQTAKAPAATCPDGRLSTSTREVEGRVVIDIDQYTPYFLATVNNKLSRGSSQIYLDKFGIGVVDWRVVALLAAMPWINASAICQAVELDKGAASRALAKLSAMGFLDSTAEDFDVRRKTWALSERGYALHEEMLSIALQRERELIEGIDPEEFEIFLKVIRQMRDNLSHTE